MTKEYKTIKELKTGVKEKIEYMKLHSSQIDGAFINPIDENTFYWLMNEIQMLNDIKELVEEVLYPDAGHQHSTSSLKKKIIGE